MRIKLTKSVIVRGHDGAKVGDELEVSPSIAYQLKALDACLIWTGATETRDPIVENRDPKLETLREKPSARRQPK